MSANDASPDAASSLTRKVYGRLRKDLLTGRWRPDGKLPMQQLRTCYDSGASPLREALSRLATEGLVVHNDQRGFTVAAVSQSELEDILRNRIALESMALAQAFEHRTPEWEETLVIALHRLSRTPRSVQPDSYEENPQWEQYHRAFHRALLMASGSPVLTGFCDQLYDRAYRYRQLAARKAYKRRNEQDEHQAIFDAVLGNDLAQAQRLLAQHYQRTAALFSAPG
jgi:DNA-binding GntR family transcriptional regulator